VRNVKTFIKHNWFKIGLLIGLLIIASSSVYYFVVIPIQQKQENLQKNQIAINNIDSQQKCADQAEKTFKENYSDAVNGSTYYDHWNIKLNKCFIFVISEFPGYINGGVQRLGHDEALYDAFEGVNYGDYTYYTSPTDILSKHEFFSCSVVKDVFATGSDSQEPCKSEAEFEAYASTLMNN
jgi:hypothetical protein